MIHSFAYAVMVNGTQVASMVSDDRLTFNGASYYAACAMHATTHETDTIESVNRFGHRRFKCVPASSCVSPLPFDDHFAIEGGRPMRNEVTAALIIR